MPKVAKVKLSLEDLLTQLKKHQARLPKLQRQERKLLKQLASVQAEIAALGGSASALAKVARGKPGRPAAAAPRRSSKRPKNSMKLADAIASVLSKDKSLSVAQIAAAVKTKGYVSTSKTFDTIIYQTLARDKRVKRAGRGQYQLKG